MLILLPLILIIIILFMIALAVFLPKSNRSNINDYIQLFETELESTNITINKNRETIKKLKKEINNALNSD